MLDQQERSAATHIAPRSHVRATEGEDKSLVAFTAQQVRELTGLSEHQLRYWDRTELVSPTDPNTSYRKPRGRIYRFRDVIGLRVIAMLRNDYHVSLPEIRKVVRWLKEHENIPPSSMRFFLRDHSVVLKSSSTAVAASSGDSCQPAVPIELATIEREMRARALQSRERTPEEIGRITRSRNVESNAWVLAGTRVPTRAVWNFHRAGHDTAAILAAYPTLTHLDVKRAIEFERERRHKQIG